jgi:16S rRNA (guanine966-N2)-methyltransferase
VIAGTARGIRLSAPGEGTRPLGDRVKQTLFAILEPSIRGRPFLDLFAGSGAAGIEALSRGAGRAVFVDRDAAAIRAIEANLAATRLAGPAAVVIRSEADRWLRSAEPPAPFAAVFADPPYERLADLQAALDLIGAAGPDRILASDGMLVAKHFWKAQPAPKSGLLRSIRERRFGETMLTFYRWVDEEDG